MAHIIILVTSDVIADQRIHRTATTLQSEGFKVTVVGRRVKSTPKQIDKPYKVKLLRLPFSKGPLFYACYNIAAFFFLIFRKFHLVHSNDLDTLLAAKAATWLRRKPMVYDSHELFTEVPELVNRPKTQKIWYRLEKRLTKNIEFCSTVSQGVAHELKARYNLNCTLIRNLPYRKPFPKEEIINQHPTIIYQGALNVGRGLETLMEAMQQLPEYRLLIIGDGPIANDLRNQAKDLNLGQIVHFYGKLPHEQLHDITRTAQLGLSIERDMGLNYRYALPNKIFDYIQAGIPVLASSLPEMKEIIEGYKIGKTINPNYTAKELATSIENMILDSSSMLQWHENTERAANELNWETEQKKLIELINRAIS